MNLIKKLKQLTSIVLSLDTRLSNMQNALGRIESRQTRLANESNIQFNEFKVSSQWGEDGIIQHLINKVSIATPVFIEFGVENYTEANTRFLLTNNNWSGLVIDGSQNNIDYIKADPIYWKHNLKTECAFIDKDNINNLFQKNGISGDLGLLSVDIDGNDYWVLEAIDSISPAIIVCEYNSLWGATRSVTTPYDASFYRGAGHYSNLYYGASVQALVDLANNKGYQLVAGNSAGNNVFFVRNDLLGNLKILSAEDVWVRSQFRESRDINGQLTFLDFDERRKLIFDMPLVDLKNQETILVGDLIEP